MIDWNASAELNHTTIEELKTWFEIHSQSHKKVVAICDICDKKRECEFKQYRPLCNLCSKRTPEARKAARLKTIEQFSNQEACDKHSEILIQFYIDHPEAREAARSKSIERMSNPIARENLTTISREYWTNQDNRDEMSEIITNSEAAKVNTDNMQGGNDICKHHYIYDHANPKKYTIKVTRSKHSKIHAWMRKAEIIVPHINVTEENKGIFKSKPIGL